jgi:hypothetical protein
MKKENIARTLQGRIRRVDASQKKNANKSNGQRDRIAINTPIQGGAADIVLLAMLYVHSNKRLRDLGWKLLLQVRCRWLFFSFMTLSLSSAVVLVYAFNLSPSLSLLCFFHGCCQSSASLATAF